MGTAAPLQRGGRLCLAVQPQVRVWNEASPGPSDVHTLSCHHTLQPGCVAFWHRHRGGQPCDCQLPWAQGGGTVSRCGAANPCHWPPRRLAPVTPPFHLPLPLTQNSELDPSLVSVLPIEGHTDVEATIFHSHWADDQRTIRLLLVSGEASRVGGLQPRQMEMGGSSFFR